MVRINNYADITETFGKDHLLYKLNQNVLRITSHVDITGTRGKKLWLCRCKIDKCGKDHYYVDITGTYIKDH